MFEMRQAGSALAAVMLAACATATGAQQPADIPIEGERVHPESITADAAGNLYVGSVPGTVYRVVAGSATAEPWIVPDAANGLTSLFGVLADDGRGLLWVCNNPPFGGPPQPGAKASLKAFDLSTGALKATYGFPGDGPAVCNDIAVGPDGTTFATDTSGGRIFALAPDGEALTPFAADPALVGVDGIAFAEDGTMYVTTSASTPCSGSTATASLTPGSPRSSCPSPSTGPTRCARFPATASSRPKAPATA